MQETPWASEPPEPRPEPGLTLPGTEPNGDDPSASPARPRRAWPPFLPAKWETRVGLAAVLSFVIVAGVAISKRGWISPRPRQAETSPIQNEPATVPGVEPPSSRSNAPLASIPSPPPADPTTPEAQAPVAESPSVIPPAMELGSPPSQIERASSTAEPPPLPLEKSVATEVPPQSDPPSPAVAPSPPLAVASEDLPPPPDEAQPAPLVPPANVTATTPAPEPEPIREERPPTTVAPPVERGTVPTLTTPPPAEPASSPLPDRPGLVPIPNRGRRRPAGATAPAGPSRRVAADRIEPVPHVVRPGENFWTIARTYYGTGRPYRALWKANEARVPRIDELYVGTTILVPAREDLDPALIDPPSPHATPRPSADREVRLDPARPADEPGLVAPRVADDTRPASPRSRLPVYTVGPHETLRSIAKKTLGDPRREDDIRKLNLDAVGDSRRVAAGTRLRLPEEARVTRR